MPRKPFISQKYGETHHYEGLRIRVSAAYNIIGCGNVSTASPYTYTPCSNSSDAYAARNIIAGNGNDGFHIQGAGVHAGSPHDNRFVGNIVGMKQDGVTILANRADAMDIEQGPYDNWIGGETALERNVIGGNRSEGIELSHSNQTTGNRIVGNYFGVDITGSKAVRNCGAGIGFEDTPNHNFAYNNVIGGNYGNGIRFYRRSTYNEVYNNIIGVGVHGEVLPNATPDSSCPVVDYGGSGIYITGGNQYNNIHDNVIANHPDAGIEASVYTVESGDVPIWGKIQKTSYNTFSHNSIYNNGGKGIHLKSATDSGVTYKANDGLAAPTIVRAGTQNAVGTACANCKIEIYLADPNASTSQGKTFLGEGMTNAAGQFNISVTGHSLSAGQKVTGTTTDSLGNTSEFATNSSLVNGAVDPLTPAATFTPTADMSGTATSEAQTATAFAATAEALETATAAAETASAVAPTMTAAAATASVVAPTATFAAQETATSAAVTATAAAAPPGSFHVMLPLMQR